MVRSQDIDRVVLALLKHHQQPQSAQVSKSKLVGPGTTSEMRFAMANEAQKAGQAGVNNPVAMGRRTVLPLFLRSLNNCPIPQSTSLRSARNSDQQISRK